MIFAFDYETHLIAPGNPAPKGVCLSWACEDGTTGLMLADEALHWLRERFAAGDDLVAHNAPYDFSVAALDAEDAGDPIIHLIFQAYYDGKIHDTGIRQKILDNAKGTLKYEWNEEKEEYKAQRYSLAHLMYRLFGVWRFNDKVGDTWRLRYYTLDGVPISEWPQEAIDYPIQDSEDCLRCFLHQREDRHAHLLDQEWTQTQADWALRLMSVWGSRTSAEDIAKLKAKLQAQYDEQVEICKSYGLVKRSRKRVNGEWVQTWSRTMAAIFKVVEAHYEQYGLSVPMTDGGKKKDNPKVSTSRATLTMEEYPEYEGSEAMLAVAAMGKIGKQLTTYIPVLELGTRLPISPRYNAILETFRTSCSGPNVQNVSRGGGLRDCWRARTGYVYGFCDYDTLEMRTLAQICIWLFGSSEIAIAIEEGKDLHAAFAARMLGIDYEEAMERLEAGDSLIVDTRQGSKIANYGMAGGMGPDAFISYARGFGVDITLDRAKELHLGFRTIWPEMVKYFEHVSMLTELKDPELGINQIVLPGSGFIRGDVRYCAVANGGFQHLAAMGAKQAVFSVSRECYTNKESPLYGCRPWLFAHDEIGMEIPFDGTDEGRIRASRAMAELERIMIESMRHYCPDVPIGATGAISLRWLKGAKPIFREINGEKTLVPCRKEGKSWVEDLCLTQKQPSDDYSGKNTAVPGSTETMEKCSADPAESTSSECPQAKSPGSSTGSSYIN